MNCAGHPNCVRDASQQWGSSRGRAENCCGEKTNEPRKNAEGGAPEVAKATVVIETPIGSRNKYKYEEESGRMKLTKVMPEGMIFPYDFGYVPGARGEDGGPLDVLVLSDAPTFAGCALECRLIGVLKAEPSEGGKKIRNDRILAVADVSVLYSGVEELENLDPTLLRQIEAFFVNYQKVRSVGYKILARAGFQAALKLKHSAKDAG